MIRQWLRKWAMRVVVIGKISAILLQAGKSQNKKITSFNLIHLHL